MVTTETPVEFDFFRDAGRDYVTSRILFTGLFEK
jgi:ATP-dependent RNA circularization protein (DNA/RNA ligase family)